MESDGAERMDKTIRKVESRSKQEQEYTHYWGSKTPEERIAEAWRLNVEKYGQPKTSLRDGTFRRIRRNASGEEEIIELARPQADETQPKT